MVNKLKYKIKHKHLIGIVFKIILLMRVILKNLYFKIKEIIIDYLVIFLYKEFNMII